MHRKHSFRLWGPCTLAVACALGACDMQESSSGAPTVVPSIGKAQRESRLCIEGPKVPGIDVSAWQGEDIDWDAIAAGGDAEFTFIRVMHGLKGDGYRDGPDAHFNRNWAEAKRVGLLRGAYQYFITAEDPIAQADFLIEKIGRLEDGDLPPVIDIEVRDSDAIAEVPVIIENIQLWLERVEDALGVRPIIYTSQSMWERMTGNSELFSDYTLWVANYNTECPLMPKPWDTWAFHQYSATGGIAGYEGDIDKNVFAGTLEELVAMATYEPEPSSDAGAFAADAGDDGSAKKSGSGCSTGGGDAGAWMLFGLASALVALRRRISIFP